MNASRVTPLAASVLLGLGVALSAGRAEVRGDEQPGVDLFIEACRHQGLNPVQIRSGYAEFELEIKTPPLSEQEIQKRIDDHIELVRTQMANAITDVGRRSVEQQIRDAPAHIRSQNGGIERSRNRVLFRGNDRSGGYRRHEILRFDPATGTSPGKPDVLLQRGMNESGGSVMWDAQARHAMVLDTVWASEEFQAFGRLEGVPSGVATALLLQGSNPSEFRFTPQGIASFMSNVAQMERGGTIAAYRLVGEERYDGDAVAQVVETRKKTAGKDQVLQRYWIDPARGYVCPLIELFDESGRVAERWKSSDYFLHEPSGLWFPALHVHTTFQPKTELFAEERTYRLDRRALLINQAVGDADFSVDLPTGARVLDARGQAQVTYKATKPLTLSLGRGDLDLQSIPGLVPLSTSRRDDRGPSLRLGWIGSVLKQNWLVVVNSVILTVLLGALAWKALRRRRDRYESQAARKAG
jgi:hypothetical protein